MWKLDKHFCPSLSFHIILFFYCFLTNKQKCCSSLSLNTVLACLCSYVPLVYFVFHFNRYFLLLILLFIPCVPHVNSQIFYLLMTVMDFRLFLFCIRKAFFYADEWHLSNQTMEDYAAKKSLPHQRLKSTISVVAPILCPRSNNGKRPRILLELREPSKKTSNGQESRKIPNSQINPVLPKSKKNGYYLENVSNEARIFKHKIVPDERYERKVKDYNGSNGSWLQA